MLEGAERLLEVPCCLAVDRLCQGLLPCLPAVCQSLLPYFPPQGMVGQPLDLLDYPVPGKRLNGLNDMGMQRSPPLMQETVVGYLMGQGMLKGILAVWKEACLVQELGLLEVRQTAMQGVFGQLSNGLEQRQRDLSANDRGCLEEPLLLGRQPVDARCQNCLHRGRHLQALDGLGQAISVWCADQHASLDQGAYAFFQKEGIALGTLDQPPLEGHQAGVGAKQGLEKCVSTGGQQRVKPQLYVVGLAAPAVLVLRAVVDQQQEL